MIDWIDTQEDGTLDYTSLEKKLPGKKLLSITGASNVTGEIIDLDRVSHMFTSL